MSQSRVTLRVFSSERPLSALRNVLGQPSSGFSIGDHWRAGKVRDRTLWALASKGSAPDSLASHIQEILSFFETRKSQFADLRPTCEIDLYCLLATANGQGGATLEPAILRAIGDTGLSVVFDVYGDELPSTTN